MLAPARSDQLQQMVQLPFGSFPLWTVASIVAIENAGHKLNRVFAGIGN
jgi:hypothetical protein